jgi:6-phosphogluconolactonase
MPDSPGRAYESSAISAITSKTIGIRLLACVVFLFLLVLPCAGQQKSREYIVYAGTYTRTLSKGIYAWRFQPSTGKLTALGLMAETSNPSYLAVHPNHRFLYAANEHENATEPGNTVTAYAMDTHTGKLRLLNKVSSRGVGPCHISIDKTGKVLVVANYGSGSVASIPILPDGRLGEAVSFFQHEGSSLNHDRQQGPHAHCAVISPDNRFVLVADLGTDQVFSYRLDPATATLEPNDPPFVRTSPGWGPRHLVFHPNGKWVYLVSEMGSRLTIFDYDAAGGILAARDTVSTLPKDFTGQSTAAEVQVDRSGRFVYASNRGDDSIAVFSLDPVKGTPTLVETVSTRGKTPRNFSLDPTGSWLFAANQNSDSVAIYRVDPNTGRLTPSGKLLKDAPEPSHILFVAAE